MLRLHLELHKCDLAEYQTEVAIGFGFHRFSFKMQAEERLRPTRDPEQPEPTHSFIVTKPSTFAWGKSVEPARGGPVRVA